MLAVIESLADRCLSTLLGVPTKSSLIGYHDVFRVLSIEETHPMIYRHLSIGLLFFSVAALCGKSTAADFSMEKPRADWIWDTQGTSSSQPIYLQKQFSVAGKVSSGSLFTVCDNTMKVWVNGPSDAQVMCGDGADGTHHGDAQSAIWSTWFEHCCLVSPDTGGRGAA